MTDGYDEAESGTASAVDEGTEVGDDDDDDDDADEGEDESGHRPNKGKERADLSGTGPVPASRPRVVEERADGVQWMEFEYNRKRGVHLYRIRCDTGTVDLTLLAADFKLRNSVYPSVLKDGASNRRMAYMRECNNDAWALVMLNPELDGQRGLIQRAVDSLRNSSNNPKRHSRRVRRQVRGPSSASSAAGGSAKSLRALSIKSEAANDAANDMGGSNFLLCCRDFTTL